MAYVALPSSSFSARAPVGWTDEELWGERYNAPETYSDPLERWVASWWTPEVSAVLLIAGGLLMFWPYDKK